MELKPITTFRFTSHALYEMARRRINESEVTQVLAKPEQLQMVRAGRAVYQARQGEPPEEYLLRVFVDVSDNPPSVVTVYRTSKIRKYWS